MIAGHQWKQASPRDLLAVQGRDDVVGEREAEQVDELQEQIASEGVDRYLERFHSNVWVASRTEPVFLLNVTLNAKKEITGVFAGDLFRAHQKGCEFVRENAFVTAASRYDVVVTTNSGYPLDQNLYQTIKGISAAAQVVKPGGTIICASECSDGIPSHGEYQKILAERETPDELLQMITTPGYRRHDQWEVQVQAQIQTSAKTVSYTHLPLPTSDLV